MRWLLVGLASIVWIAGSRPVEAQAPAEADLDVTGWQWTGCSTGLVIGGSAAVWAAPRLIVEDDGTPGRETDAALSTVGVLVGSLAISAGLCAAGLFGFSALAEHGDFSEDLGYALATGETLAFLGVGIGIASASVLETTPEVSAAAGTSAAIALGLVGALLAGVALRNDDTEDPRFNVLLSGLGAFTASFLVGLLFMLPLEADLDDIVLVSSGVGAAAMLGTALVYTAL